MVSGIFIISSDSYSWYVIQAFWWKDNSPLTTTPGQIPFRQLAQLLEWKVEGIFFYNETIFLRLL